MGTRLTYQHFTTLDEMADRWNGRADQFDKVAVDLEKSVRAGERTWQEAFSILRYGTYRPVSDQDREDALHDLQRLGQEIDSGK